MQDLAAHRWRRMCLLGHFPPAANLILLKMWETCVPALVPTDLPRGQKADIQAALRGQMPSLVWLQSMPTSQQCHGVATDRRRLFRALFR